MRARRLFEIAAKRLGLFTAKPSKTAGFAELLISISAIQLGSCPLPPFPIGERHAPAERRQQQSEEFRWILLC